MIVMSASQLNEIGTGIVHYAYRAAGVGVSEIATCLVVCFLVLIKLLLMSSSKT